jgi:hypothetical protein
MIEVKSTLNGDTEKQLDPTKAYLVDFSKLASVNDLMLVLAGLGITYPATHPHIEVLKPFLNLDNPIDIPQQQPKPKGQPFVPLDKLDTPQK